MAVLRTGVTVRAMYLDEGGVPLVAERMSPGGAILCESRVKEPLPEKVGAFCRKKSYRYGKIMLTLYRRPEEGEGEL